MRGALAAQLRYAREVGNRGASVALDRSWRFPPTRRAFGAVTVLARPPRLRDAEAWSASRVAERSRLEAAFGSPDEDWVTMNSPLAWVERWLRLRTAAGLGRAWPLILLRDGHPDVWGELGLDAIDSRTGTGEISAWRHRDLPSAAVPWALASVILRAFSAPVPLRRITAPMATGSPSSAQGVLVLGFRHEITIRGLRDYRGVRSDHDVFVLDNSEVSRRALCATLRS